MNSKTLTLAAALIGMLLCVNAYADDMAFGAKGNLFVLKDKSIVKYAPDGTKTIFANLPSPFFLAVDNTGNLFGKSGAAIFEFKSDGSRSTSISDRFSPDKQWAYRSTAALGIVKVGTDQVVLDLSDAPSLCRVLGATVAWAPDSKRLAFNYAAP